MAQRRSKTRSSAGLLPNADCAPADPAHEPKVGISRAVRVGNFVSVSGSAPLGPDGRTLGAGDAAAQARRCLEIISVALEKAGASLKDVVRTRTLLVRIEDWQAVAAVHGEVFREIRPANTIMQVSRFIDSDWLVELDTSNQKGQQKILCCIQVRTLADRN
jgi:enamine deaminase RidA (YjgF/YER057c/UK114 family)